MAVIRSGVVVPAPTAPLPASPSLVQIIPAIDLENGRSRVVYWPGASAGVGVPTDRPDRIAERFVEQGARIVHLVDFDGARAGEPVNLEAIGSVAARVAVPLQVAGGLDSADGIRLAFAAGATRAVLAMSIVDQPDRLKACLEVAGDWLAVGLDPRPDRLAAFPWQRPEVPSLETLVTELIGLGVRRLVLGHGRSGPDLDLLARLVRSYDAEILVAGGAPDPATISQIRDAGVAGLILGESLLSGAIDFPAALEAAA
jgi:phosphoribosylformimino-5-aminoimidazole carboxamide ribotide isomerase